MFNKLFIANRGEIALRIMRTAKRLGIPTVVGYSRVDEDDLFVRSADEAVLLGEAAPAASYLATEKLIKAAKKFKCDALHPGYGFLSENAEFAKAVAKAGIEFVGPSPSAIAQMGDKLRSKELANKAGVNTINGSPIISEVKKAFGWAEDIGYPVMIKAAMGGGGKGMRVAYNKAELEEGFARASSEAKTSFGDGRVFLEKFIENPRHIEIQVIADKHGNAVHLGERECSIQRRHQKIVEESPSPLVDPKMRATMGSQAVSLAKAVGYSGVGTVEFVADNKKGFWFLEMNTRLQVEHPVTEFVTQTDLVEEMLRIAKGEKLRFKAAPKPKGWAMEARIYAEDPARGFLPSSGRISDYSPPMASSKVRVDDSIEDAGRISTFYDPMIAKLITHGATRGEAIGLMETALNQYVIKGIRHNLDFLSELFAHKRFIKGDLSNHFITDEWKEGYSETPATGDIRQTLLAVAAFLAWQQDLLEVTAKGQAEGHEITATKRWDCIVQGADKPISVTIEPKGDTDTAEVKVADGSGSKGSKGSRGSKGSTGGSATRLIQLERLQRNGLLTVVINRTRTWIKLSHQNSARVLTLNGKSIQVLTLRPQTARLYGFMPPPSLTQNENRLLSPMPGLLVALRVKVGDKVNAGEDLAIVEAMKMENVLKAEREGTVKELLAEVGDSLDADQPIVEFE